MSDEKAIAELHEVVKLQRAAFLKDQAPSLEERLSRVGKIPGMVMTHRQAIRDALKSDYGTHPDGVTDLVEVLGPAGRAQFIMEQLPTWIKDEPVHVAQESFGAAKAYIHREAKGVIGNIVPFNFPFDLSLGPLCEMLAGGNRVVIKPSEYTPACGKILKKMINETFPRDLVEVVLGDLGLSKEFPTIRWDHLLYTGSPGVGRLIMAQAAKNLVPVTLELGGKCPVIVLPGGVTERNVENILATKLLKNGQMCISVDTIYVAAADLDNFIKLGKEYFAKLQGYSKGDDCTSIISSRHFDRLRGIETAAEKAGARIIDLEDNAKADSTTRKMPVRMILNPSEDLAIRKEEIFGSLIQLRTFDKYTEAVDDINKGERPLGLYIFGDDEPSIQYITDNTKSGGLAINAVALQGALPSLGFGGVGESGMGRHHGWEGYREFTSPRGVFRRSEGPDGVALFYPPYANTVAVADTIFKAAGL